MPLQRDSLRVDPPGEHQIAVVTANVVVGDIGDQGVVLGVGDPLSLRGEQLNQLVFIVALRPGGRRRQIGLDGHRPPSRRPAGSPLRPVVTHGHPVPR